MAYCGNCKKQIDDGSAFCPYCGSKNVMPQGRKVCPSCGAQIQDGQLFCKNCGTACGSSSAKQQYQPTGSKDQNNRGFNNAVQYQQANSTTPAKAGFEISGIRALYVLMAVCILFCWPVGIYALYCALKAPKAGSKAEADAIVRKATNVCWIGLGIMLVLVVIAML